MIKRIVGSTSIYSNIHEVVNDDNNRYMSMMMNVMEINHSYLGEGLRVDKELNVDAIRFFQLLKDSNKPWWDGYINKNKLSFIAKSVYHQVSI